jgi:6-pyruvoyltetrahydropterin/6-carboxytetrahydropterin synthase
MDFADLDKAVEPLFEQLDHRYLNDVDGLRNPTCEVICRWLWARLVKTLPGLSEVAIWEGPNSGCRLRASNATQVAGGKE